MTGILDQIVRWNLVVAGVAVMLATAGFAWLERPPHVPVLVVVGLGSLLVYTLDRRLPFSPEDGPAAARVGAVAVAAAAGAPCLAAYAWLTLAPAGRATVLVLAASSAAYILPLLPGKKRLKDIPFLKTVLVGLGWAAATVLLPGAQGGGPMGSPVWCLFAYRALYLVPNLLLADVPDRAADLAAGIHTPANRLSETALIRACYGVVAAAGAVLVAGVLVGLLPVFALAELPALLVLLRVARPPLPTDRRFFLLVVDGLAGWPVVPALAWYLLGS